MNIKINYIYENKKCIVSNYVYLTVGHEIQFTLIVEHEVIVSLHH